MGDFSEKVFNIVRKIPQGHVSSYGQVARLIGAPRSARYVGYALRANPEPGTDSSRIPCHRVVFKDGSLCKSFIFGGPDEQRTMLEEEGVCFTEDGRVDMNACLWNGDTTACNEDEGALPTAPPADFNWERELGE